MADVDVDMRELARRIGAVASKGMLREMTRSVASSLLEFVKDHLDEMAATRHKVADRLGAEHTRCLEFASGRVAGSKTGQTTKITAESDSSATISILNTPGLTRAYHDLDIAPTKGKKWLTIPISRVSYGKRVADLRGMGRRVFRMGRSRVLAVSDETGKGRARPVYALVKSVRIPRDRGLLPTRAQLVAKGREKIAEALEVAAMLAD